MNGVSSVAVDVKDNDNDSNYENFHRRLAGFVLGGVDFTSHP